MIEMSATVQNELGIHCRPSAVLLEAAKNYPGEITVTASTGSTKMQSVLELISLGLFRGAKVTIRVAGPDEEGMCRRLAEMFERHFDFPPREAR